jgi:hypothetical protein
MEKINTYRSEKGQKLHSAILDYINGKVEFREVSSLWNAAQMEIVI